MRSGKLLTTLTLTLFLSMLPGKNFAWQNAGEYQTRSGKSFFVKESHPVGQSLSDISIQSVGFEYNFSQTFRDCDPIAQIIVTDLDNNGFDELYIVTVSAGSGSYGNIMGFASNRDKSVSMIHFPQIEIGDIHFIGYMGHDSFRVVDGMLARTFPVYLTADNNVAPTGETRTLMYRLHHGEASWQLKIANPTATPNN